MKYIARSLSILLLLLLTVAVEGVRGQVPLHLKCSANTLEAVEMESSTETAHYRPMFGAGAPDAEGPAGAAAAELKIANASDVPFQVPGGHGSTVSYRLLMGTTESERDRMGLHVPRGYVEQYDHRALQFANLDTMEVFAKARTKAAECLETTSSQAHGTAIERVIDRLWQALSKTKPPLHATFPTTGTFTQQAAASSTLMRSLPSTLHVSKTSR